MPLRCLLVEDEPLAAERLAEYIGRLPNLHLLGSFDNALDALSFLQTNDVELLFLDINLGGMTGIELLETAAVTSQIILTTAHAEHALRSYDFEVTDYLLKPFTFPRFVQAVNRAQANLAARGPKRRPTFIFVKNEQRLERIELAQILYIEGAGDYRRIHTAGKRILTLQTFAELEQTIAEDVVCRVHKSYMVALARIDSVERDRIRIGDKLIPISETYRARFYAFIGQR